MHATVWRATRTGLVVGCAAVLLGGPARVALAPETEESLLDKVVREQQIQVQALRGDVQAAMRRARTLLRTNPAMAERILSLALETVKASRIRTGEVLALKRRLLHAIRQAQAAREQFELRRVDRQEQAARRSDAQRRAIVGRQKQAQIDQLLRTGASLVAQARYRDAARAAETALAIDPNSVAAQTMLWRAVKAHKAARARGARAFRKEVEYETVRGAMGSSVGFPARSSAVYPDPTWWEAMTLRRAKYKAMDLTAADEKVRQIEQTLAKPVTFDFADSTLSDVMDFLRDFTGQNIVLDRPALEEEGVSADTTVSLKLTGVSLRSALRLVLDQVNLTYVIRDDVLLVTSKTRVTGMLRTRVYPVADLVVPIPNYGSGSGTGGLAGASGIGGRGAGGAGGTGGGGGGFARGGGGGGGGASGAGDDRADRRVGDPLDHLAGLVETTIAPQSWSTVGGPGTIHTW